VFGATMALGARLLAAMVGGAHAHAMTTYFCHNDK